MIIECANCGRGTDVESLVGAVCPDCRDMATMADLREENEQLRAALEQILQAPYHTYGDSETILDACFEITRRALERGQGRSER